MPDYISMYTDGACKGNPGPMGIGVVMFYGEYKKTISLGIGQGTNNIAELTAIKIGLENISDKSIPIKIYTDSKYAKGVLSQNWKANTNQDLIESIKTLMMTFKKIEFLYVKGHSGISGNEIANSLATGAI